MKREYRGNGLLYSLFLMKVLRSGVKAFAQLINARAPAYFPAQEAGGIDRAFPQIIKGPDLWAFFQNNQNLISNDNLHPTDTGFGAYRQQWANAMLTTVYKT